MELTEIAVLLHPGGSTSHKTFGLKVPLILDSVSNYKPRSAKSVELSKVEVFDGCNTYAAKMWTVSHRSVAALY